MFQKFPGDPRLYKVSKMNITDKKNTVFCLNSENGLTCSYYKRIDHFNEDLRKGILHKCNYSKKTKKCENITQFLQRLADGEQLDIEPNNLLDTLVETTGKLNISLESGRSEELYELIQVAVAFGASIVFNGKNIGWGLITRNIYNLLFISN